MTPDLFAVCPHDTARGFEKWALLNTFANKHVRVHSKFHLYMDFTEFGADLDAQRFAWAYLNPADYLKASGRLGYEAVARPVGRFDKAYVIAAAPAASAAEIAGKRLAAVKGYLFSLVQHKLTSQGVLFELVPAKSYGEVMKLVEHGDADFGVTYNEHFDVLIPATREKFTVVDSMDLGLSHVLVAHSAIPAELRQGLAALLLDAAARDDGRAVLAELGMTGFEAVPEAPFAALREIIQKATT